MCDHDLICFIRASLIDVWAFLLGTVRGPPFNLQGRGDGVFVVDKLFISTRLGGALKIYSFITIYYKFYYVYIEQFLQEIMYFMQSLPEFFISKIPQPPLPWRLNGGPLTKQVVLIPTAYNKC